MPQVADRAVRRCPRCGSRLEAAARTCGVCGVAVPWRLTPRGIVIESVLAVGLAALTIGGLLWARSRWTAPVSPVQVAVDQLASHTPTDMPTFTPAPEPTVATPAATAPGGSPDAAPPAAPAGAPAVITHVIESGDSLYAIAMANGISLDDLLAANPGMTTDSFLAIGQELKVPAPGAEPQAGAPEGGKPPEAQAVDPVETPAGAEPDASAPTAAPSETVHVVEPGDTLLALADSSGVTIDELVEWNDLSGPDALLSIGQSLTVRPTQPATAASGDPSEPLAAAGASRGDPELQAQLGETIDRPSAFPAPDLLAPGQGTTLTDETPYLRWASVGILPESAYYVVMIREVPAAAIAAGTNPPPPPTGLDDVEVIWALDNVNAVRVPTRFRPAFGTTARLQWAVSVRRRTEGLISSGLGEALSAFSAWRTFNWVPGGE